MSGKAARRMREILNGTEAYRLTGESLADREINACGAGFDLLERELEGLLADLFISTASESRLAVWEQTLRGQASGGTPDERRAALAGRLSMNPRRFRPEDFPSLLRAAGLEGAVREESGGLRIFLGKLLGIPGEEARLELDRLLPSHLAWEWDEGVCWAALDAWLPKFEALDGLGLSWEELDGLSREEWEQLGKEES